jgi:hypothetical protein
MYSKQDIERYILGQMSASEKVAFAEQLSSDSALKEEVKNATVAILEQMAEMKTNSGELATEAIERYIRKEMSASEAAAFENECEANPVLAYSYRLQESLSREVRLHAAVEMLKNKKAGAKVIDFTKILKSVTPVAVAACMVCGCMIWDHNVTVNVGNEAYASVMRGGSELDSLVEAKDYKAAIALIDEQLNVDYEIDDPEAKAAWEEDMKDLQYQKAVILLKDGKKRQAKKILKALDDEPSRELLDKLLW